MQAFTDKEERLPEDEEEEVLPPEIYDGKSLERAHGVSSSAMGGSEEVQGVIPKHSY